MKKLIWLLIGILLGIILAGIVVWNVMPGQMIRVVKSAYGFDETVSMVQEAAFQNEWEVLHVYDFEACVQEHGYEGEIFRINVISICQTEYSYNILQDDKDKSISAIMPCRIGVYETTGGEVYITRMNIGLFSKMFKGKVGEILRTVAEDDEKIIGDISE